MIEWVFIILLTTGTDIGVLPVRGFDNQASCIQFKHKIEMEVSKNHGYLEEGKVAQISLCFELKPLPEEHVGPPQLR